MKVLGTWGAVFGTLLVLDALWLAVIARPLYVQGIGHLMAGQPNLAVAAAFYVLYAVGLTVFAVWPGGADPAWRGAALKGAMFGFFAYATYDLTNWATLKDWPATIALVDMAWGTVVSACSAAAGRLALDRLSA